MAVMDDEKEKSYHATNSSPSHSSPLFVLVKFVSNVLRLQLLQNTQSASVVLPDRGVRLSDLAKLK